MYTNCTLDQDFPQKSQLTSIFDQTSIDLNTFTNKVNNYDYEELDIYMSHFVSSNCHDPLDVSELIKNIKINFTSWVKSGLILKSIKDNFAFIVLNNSKLPVKKWKDFCLTQFNKTSWYINNIIKAAEVVLILWKNGFDILPTCESQAKPLTKFLPNYVMMDDSECEEWENTICELWQKVLEASKDKHLTASLIKTVINPDRLEYQDRTVKINPNTFDKLLEQALQHNFLTVAEYLDAIANNELSPLEDNIKEKTSQEKQEIWENDLQQLVDENLPEPLPELPEPLLEPLPEVLPESEPLPEVQPEVLPEPLPVKQQTAKKDTPISVRRSPILVT